jgi:pre-mRNA-splicing factor 18
MFDNLEALKLRTKSQISEARRQISGELMKNDAAGVNEGYSGVEDRQAKIREHVVLAESILPETPVSDETLKQLNDRLTDLWAGIFSEFKRQLDSASDLRVLIADDEIMIEHDHDHPTVRFFKSLLNEWKIRLFSLPDDELNRKKRELALMWHCVFALQPLFYGLNDRSLSPDISIETEKITECLKRLDYKNALEHYNILAIGNNLWPIGITQYSIHWKFSCDRIDSDRMLHLFNGEVARTAIISIKRLMTKHQEFYHTM